MSTNLRQGVLVFDGDCGICTTLAGVASTHVRRPGDGLVISAYQDLDLAPLGLSAAQCDEALQWVAPDGTVSSAQNAVARLLLRGRLWQRPAGLVLLMPGVNWVAGWSTAGSRRIATAFPGEPPPVRCRQASAPPEMAIARPPAWTP